jgi:translation initiation factor 1
VSLNKGFTVIVMIILIYPILIEYCLRTMAEICATCGLPKDICVCGEISKDQQRIRVRLETRKFGKAVTIIDGISDKDTDLGRLAQKMKAFCACGGTAKNGQILLQGDHRDKVHDYLLQAGYPEENLEVT